MLSGLLDKDLLLVVAGVLLTSRAWKGALTGWIEDGYGFAKWLRKQGLNDIYTRISQNEKHIRNIEADLEEHISDREIHRRDIRR